MSAEFSVNGIKIIVNGTDITIISNEVVNITTKINKPEKQPRPVPQWVQSPATPVQTPEKQPRPVPQWVQTSKPVQPKYVEPVHSPKPVPPVEGTKKPVPPVEGTKKPVPPVQSPKPVPPVPSSVKKPALILKDPLIVGDCKVVLTQDRLYAAVSNNQIAATVSCEVAPGAGYVVPHQGKIYLVVKNDSAWIYNPETKRWNLGKTPEEMYIGHNVETLHQVNVTEENMEYLIYDRRGAGYVCL